MEYTFTLRYQLSDSNRNIDETVERLAAAGCDDALVGTGLPGRLALQFQREAESADAALGSALADVRAAIPDSRLIEIGPDYAGLTDVANFVGMSRQNVRKLMLSHHATFPPPVHEGSASIWHLAEVLAWLQSRGYAVAEELLEVARLAMRLNVEQEQRRVGSELPTELQGLAS
ncbi:AlpA family transcriptional regulator [Cupriavidus sp. AU9028]|uniref:helix-turn-helix transcriptional regulator n=1 Tax=Cupriavidus sp. AU9028 TaxID=2871157 RepID=UPI001C96111B|nr:DNA-binding protein [Cupriavidus sp. AU9028]MBY4897966.1 DNA-binding protein [Cupriavidus sp. AU9028]